MSVKVFLSITTLELVETKAPDWAVWEKSLFLIFKPNKNLDNYGQKLKITKVNKWRINTVGFIKSARI